MKLKKNGLKLPVINFDDLVETDKIIKRHGALLPDNIRAIICGPSNSGKTNALLTLITHRNGVRFENIYIYSKSLNQPKYRFLEKIIKPLKEVGYFPFSDGDQVINVEDVKHNSIMIFDDVACEKQDNIRAYFCMGRHRNVDSFYLCQTYARIPKHLVRDNANFLILFRQDEMNMKHIYNDHITTDMSFIQFRDICGKCWNSNKYGFIVINKDDDINHGRYRNGFDSFINI